MDHCATTAEIKDATRRRRRLEGKALLADELDALDAEESEAEPH